MLITHGEFADMLHKRNPHFSRAEITELLNLFIKTLRNRILKNLPIIIDNFGILNRTRRRFIKIFCISTKKHKMIISETVDLAPSGALKDFFKDKPNRAIIRKKIVKKSEEYFKKIGRRKSIIL